MVSINMLINDYFTYFGFTEPGVCEVILEVQICSTQSPFLSCQLGHQRWVSVAIFQFTTAKIHSIQTCILTKNLQLYSKVATLLFISCKKKKLIQWLYVKKKKIMRGKNKGRIFFIILLDSLYYFVKLYVKIKIEMQGLRSTSAFSYTKLLLNI